MMTLVELIKKTLINLLSGLRWRRIEGMKNFLDGITLMIFLMKIREKISNEICGKPKIFLRRFVENF